MRDKYGIKELRKATTTFSSVFERRRRLDRLGSLAERGDLKRARTAICRCSRRRGRRTPREPCNLGLSQCVDRDRVGAHAAAPGGPPVIGATRLNQMMGYAGLTAATILGLRVLVAVGHRATEGPSLFLFAEAKGNTIGTRTAAGQAIWVDARRWGRVAWCNGS
jgi:hypothetical protein